MNTNEQATSIVDRIRTSFSAQTLMQTLGAELVLVADGEVQIAMSHGAGVLQQHCFGHAGHCKHRR